MGNAYKCHTSSKSVKTHQKTNNLIDMIFQIVHVTRILFLASIDLHKRAVPLQKAVVELVIASYESSPTSVYHYVMMISSVISSSYTKKGSHFSNLERLPTIYMIFGKKRMAPHTDRRKKSKLSVRSHLQSRWVRHLRLVYKIKHRQPKS